MTVLIGFLLLAFLVGGSNVGRHVRAQPWWLVAFTVIVAASFYSLRVVQ